MVGTSKRVKGGGGCSLLWRHGCKRARPLVVVAKGVGGKREKKATYKGRDPKKLVAYFLVSRGWSESREREGKEVKGGWVGNNRLIKN